MDVAPEQKLSMRLLGSLGRDEMNLAEFPITLLTDRVPKDQDEAIYQDEIYDELTGRVLARKLTIQAGKFGLATAIDDEVILALIQITKQTTNFGSRKVEFRTNDLIKTLGWYDSGASYQRIQKSLDRWTSVYLKYENAWRDNRTKTWKTIGFHIIDKYELNDGRSPGDQPDLVPSYIVWGEDIFESFQAGYLKPLDYDLCTGLSNSTARRMYRFLDKRFHHKADWTFGLKEFAHEHIGLGRNYEGPAHVKRNLRPAIGELEEIGFLLPLPEAERFPGRGREWSIRLIRRDPAAPGVAPPEVVEEPPPFEAELVGRGVTRKTARGLVLRFAAERIGRQIEVFDWLVEKKDRRVQKSPAGYLVKSIEDEYEIPKGFVAKAERERAEAAREASERQASRDRDRQREREARDLAEKEAVDAYWQSLDPEARAELEEAARDRADPETLALLEGPFREAGRRLCREAYIRAILPGQGQSPARS
jgi:Replication initiator protein A